MKILIDDGMQIRVGTGIGKYSKYLYDSLCKLNKNKIHLDNYQCKGSSKASTRLQYLLYINSWKYFRKLKSYDIVHYTNYAMPLIKNNKVKYVVTIHDLASFICPETLPKVYRYYNTFIIKHAMKHADIIITVSNSVKDEIKQYFPNYVHKVKVIYPGLYNEIELTDNDKLYDNKALKNIKKCKFFLFVGTIEKRKNVGIIIDAFIKLKDKYSEALEYKLVLAGRAGYGYDDYLKLVSDSNYAKDIVFTGYINKNDCNKLYNEAVAYILPSIYEGFGSTQTECMRCHLPLILSDISTNREISKEYGEYFNLNNIESLVNKMEKIVLNTYDKHNKNKLADEYIKKFDWDTLINEYIFVYSDLIN